METTRYNHNSYSSHFEGKSSPELNAALPSFQALDAYSKLSEVKRPFSILTNILLGLFFI